jgi:SanA protein
VSRSAAGVPPCDLFLDHAGFDTHATLYRARAVFGVERALVVSQEYHLPRALYYARRLGIEATGVSADRRRYEKRFFYAAREVPARWKALFVTELGLEPRFLGPRIPITGDGRATRG